MNFQERQAFNKAYWLHQPPEVRALQSLPLEAINEQDPGKDPVRVAEAKRLMGKGFYIDVPIMVWDWEPALMMELRIGYGQPGSLNLADYPPFDPPAPVPPPPAKDELIGPPVIGIPNWFYSGVGDSVPDGERVTTETKGTFLKHRTPGSSIFGGTSWIQFWEKVG